MWPGAGTAGSAAGSGSTRTGSSLSTRLGPRPTWHRFAVGHRKANAGRIFTHRLWRTMTFIAALRFGRIDASFVLDGPSGEDAFRVQVERFLVPTLAPKDVVVTDKLPCHKGRTVRRAVRRAGAHLRFLSPYSPDLNPIEQVFAKFKHPLRKAVERTAEANWRRIGNLLDNFPPVECANRFRNPGFAST